MARILIITQRFPPETNPGATRAIAMANALAEHHEIKVITLKPGYPQPEMYENISLRDFDRGLPFEVVRLFHFKPHVQPLTKRGLAELWMAIRLINAARREAPDIVIIPTPSMFLAPVGWVFARLKAAKFVWDLHDLTWLYLSESTSPAAHRRIFSTSLERWMKFHLRRSDLVVGLTSGVSRVCVEDYGVDAEKVFTSYMGIDREFIRLVEELTNQPDRDSPVVTYLGLFGYNHGISILLDVAKILPQVKFVLVGDGPEGEHIGNRLQNEMIPNVTLLGYLAEKKEIADVYAGSNILFNHTKDTPILNRTVVSAKLFEYMATGRPMVYAGKGMAVEYLDSIGCALTVEPHKPRAVAEAITELLNDPQKMAEMGRRGKEYVLKNSIREDLMNIFVKELANRFDLSN